MRWLNPILAMVAAGAMAGTVLGQTEDRPQPPGDEPGNVQEGERGRGEGRGGERGEGRGGERAGMRTMMQLTPEQAQAAWKVQASGVALSLSLDSSQTEKLTAAWAETKQNLRTASEKLREELMERIREGAGDDAAEGRGQFRGLGQEMQQKLADLTNAEREKLEKALKQFLDEAQTKKAMATLGSFTPSWDRMVHVITTFELEQAKKDAALKEVQSYVTAVNAVRQSTDEQARAAAIDEARQNLMDAMGKLLDREQLARFRPATRDEMRGGRFGGGEGRPRGDGAGGAGAADDAPGARGAGRRPRGGGQGSGDGTGGGADDGRI